MIEPLEIGPSVRASIIKVRWAAAAAQPPWRWNQLGQPTGPADRVAEIHKCRNKYKVAIEKLQTHVWVNLKHNTSSTIMH